LGYIRYVKKRNVKQRTIQLLVGCLKHYYNWQINQSLREDNPTTGIEIRGVKRKMLHEIFTLQELEMLYNSYGAKKEETANKVSGKYQVSELVAKRNKAMLSLLIYQGITTAELEQLTVKDLQLREGKVYVPSGRKTNDRTLELKSHQVLDLMEYTLQVRAELLQESGKQTEQLFITTGTSDRLRGAIQKLVKQLTQRHSKLKSLQQIRASVITYWLGIYNLREVQYRAGHKYVSSTESYKVNQLEDLKEDIEKYHPIG